MQPKPSSRLLPSYRTKPENKLIKRLDKSGLFRKRRFCSCHNVHIFRFAYRERGCEILDSMVSQAK